MRITHIDNRSLLAYALIFAGCILLLDLVVILLLWAAMSVMGIFSALGVGVGVTMVLGLGLLLAIAHGAVTAIVLWLAGVAFNLTTAWTGGLSLSTSREAPVVLPDTAYARFGSPREAGVASPSVSAARAAVKEVTVKHDG